MFKVTQGQVPVSPAFFYYDTFYYDIFYTKVRNNFGV